VTSARKVPGYVKLIMTNTSLVNHEQFLLYLNISLLENALHKTFNIIFYQATTLAVPEVTLTSQFTGRNSRIL
jgi:hypothetical protein